MKAESRQIAQKLAAKLKFAYCILQGMINKHVPLRKLS